MGLVWAKKMIYTGLNPIPVSIQNNLQRKAAKLDAKSPKDEHLRLVIVQFYYGGLVNDPISIAYAQVNRNILPLWG
jgi:hypothetical protein